MDNGWIKLWRKVLSNPIFLDDSLFKCWVYCLLRANHDRNDFLINKQLVSCEPGEFVTGRDSANRDLGWKSKKFDRKCIFLEKYGFLTRQVTSHFTKIKIINWNTYQGANNGDDQQYDQQMTNQRPADDQPMTTNKNVKNEKNVKKRVLLSDEEWIAQIKILYPTLDVDQEIRNCTAHFLPDPPSRQRLNNWFRIALKKNTPFKPKVVPQHHKEEQAPKWIKEAMKEGWKV